MGGAWLSILSLLTLLVAPSSTAGTLSLSVSEFNLGADAAQVRGSSAHLWSHAYVGIEKPQDWAPYDALIVTLRNRGRTVLPLQLEIRDDQSHDYWTRSNQSFAVGPGRHEFRFSARPKSGEALRPGRDLDFHHIHSLILSRDASVEGQEIEIESIRLESEAGLRPAGVYAFNFGPETTTPFPGMVVVHPSSLFNAKSGFGFVKPKIWNPYPQACALRGPDSLYRNCVMIYGGGFRVSLPNGRYQIFVNIDHPGGFWGEFPIFKRRRVRAQGQVVLDEKMEPALALKKFFQFENRSDFEGMDVFETYVSELFHEKTFSVQVQDGFLNLEFENQGCGQIACFGLALSTLVIYPEERAPQGREFLSAVRARRKKEFNDQYYQVTSDSEKSGTSHVESAHGDSEAIQWFVPELERPISQQGEYSKERQASKKGASAFANRGEEALVSFAVRVNREASPLEIEAGSLKNERGDELSAAAAKPGWVLWKQTRLAPDGSQFRVSERYWRPGSSVSPRAGFWDRALIRFKIPTTQAAGRYTGKIRVRLGKGSRLEIPVEIQVFKTPLKPLNFGLGSFGSTVIENWWFDLDSKPRARAILEQSLTKMREDGLTSFSFSPQIGFSEKKGKIDLDLGHLREMMVLAKRKGFTELVGYSEVFKGLNLCTMDISSNRVAGLFDQLNHLAVKEAWLPLTLVLCDEPEGEGLDTVLDRMKQWPTLPSSARVRWSVTTHLGANSSSKHASLVAGQGYPFLAEFADHELPKHSWAFYNNSSRINFGFRLFSLRAKSPLQLRLAWTWNQNSGNPYYALDGREDDYNWCNSTETGDLICTLQYYRQILRGVQDYRYALTLRSLLESSKNTRRNSEAANEATVLLSQLDQLNPQIEDWNPRLNDLRLRIATLIDVLTDDSSTSSGISKGSVH